MSSNKESTNYTQAEGSIDMENLTNEERTVILEENQIAMEILLDQLFGIIKAITTANMKNDREFERELKIALIESKWHAKKKHGISDGEFSVDFFGYLSDHMAFKSGPIMGMALYNELERIAALRASSEGIPHMDALAKEVVSLYISGDLLADTALILTRALDKNSDSRGVRHAWEICGRACA